MRLCTKQTIATPGETQAVPQGAVQQNALGEMAAVVELGARRVPEVHAEGGLYHSSSMQLAPSARAKSGRRGAYSSALLTAAANSAAAAKSCGGSCYLLGAAAGWDWDWDAADGFVATWLLMAPLQQYHSSAW